MKQSSNYTVEQRAAARWQVDFISKLGEKISVEFEKCVTPEKLTKNSLMAQWVAHGWLPTPLPSHWVVNVYAYEKNGFCHSWYNPTIKEEFYREYNCELKEYEENSRNVINFAWVLEATEQNAKKIFAKILKMANNGIKKITNKKEIHLYEKI